MIAEEKQLEGKSHIKVLYSIVHLLHTSQRMMTTASTVEEHMKEHMKMTMKSGRKSGLAVIVAGGGITIDALGWERYQRRMLSGSVLSVNRV